MHILFLAFPGICPLPFDGQTAFLLRTFLLAGNMLRYEMFSMKERTPMQRARVKN